MSFQQTNKGLDSTGATHPILTDSAGRTKISHGQPDPVSATLAALNDQIAVFSDGFSDITFYFGSPPTGSNVITFEQSPDSTNGTDGTWFSVVATNQGANAAAAVTATITTANATYRVSAPAGSWVRARVSTHTSGSISAQAVTTTSSFQSQITATLSSTTVVVASTTLLPSATVGGTTTPYFAAALTAKAAIKTTAGSVLHVNFYNPNTTDVYMQMFNTALASVTLGTTVPIRSFWVPAGGSYTDDFTYYHRYATAITIGPWSKVDNSAGAAPSLGIVTNVDYI